MAEIASWPKTLSSVNDSPYSRVLQRIDAEARGINEPEDSGTGDEQEDEQGDESTVSSKLSSKGSSNGNESGGCTETPCTSALKEDLVKLQKQQAWLRGGAAVVQPPKDSETSSIRTATRKKRSQHPGLLEALFLPKSVSARASMIRRHSTAEGMSRATSLVAESIASPSIRSQKSTYSPRKDKPKASSRLSLFESTPPPTIVRIVCITCLAEDIPIRRSAKLECGHRMCYTCLKRIFTLSTTDPQLMPPRCCTENVIPLRHVDRLFDGDFKRIWNRKFAEYSTKDRLYCPTKGCGQWIKPKYLELDRSTGRRMGFCNKCKAKVCKKCNMRWHGSRQCRHDDGTKRVIEMGEEQGWQRCYSCRTMVQLAEGCNHMKCHCNAEFCMICGSKWKTCDCPWFNLPPDIFISNEYNEAAQYLEDRVRFLDTLPRPTSPPFDPVDQPAVLTPDLPAPLRPRPRRARTAPTSAEFSSREDQEAADEALARRLQEQELHDDVDEMPPISAEDSASQAPRQRAARRARRRVYAITEDDAILEYDPAAANPELVDDANETTGNEALIAGLRGNVQEGRVENWRRHI